MDVHSFVHKISVLLQLFLNIYCKSFEKIEFSNNVHKLNVKQCVMYNVVKYTKALTF